ncbi:hypothetical protein WR25_13062 [Diploscapter pachys]|uniref:NR LBD domain-containing protein n=1 Tax=Diploscapter pachys TaxID=2018661 RepID=A0A2A2J279_9BILA|nr:hypothetical protein WR25_13062 [Diploscapter pachys]
MKKEDRYLCRYCRYQRCLELGMQPHNVKNCPMSPNSQENGDRSDSLIDLSDEELTPFEHLLKQLRIPAGKTKRVELNSLFDVNRLKQQVHSQLNTLVIPFAPEGMNCLQRMEHGLAEYRQNQKTNLKMLEVLDLKLVLPLWERGFLKFAKWMTYNEDFYKLPIEQKFLLFRSNAVCWRRVERMQMSLQIFGNETVLKDKMLVLSDEHYGKLFTIKMDFSPISDYSFETIRYMFKPLINRSYDKVVRPFADLSVTPTEFTYILCQLAFFCDGDDYLDFATREAMAQFRMKLAGDLHEYYTNHMHMENYAARLMKITGLVQAIQKSHAERKKIMEITKLFDLFKIDLCEQETIIK